MILQYYYWQYQVKYYQCKNIAAMIQNTRTHVLYVY